MRIFSDISIPHGFLDFLGTCAIAIGSGTWAHHRKWRESMDRRQRACVLGINFLISQHAGETPDFVKRELEEAMK